MGERGDSSSRSLRQAADTSPCRASDAHRILRTLFGKKLGEYVGFQKPVLILITLVWAARLALSLAGVPDPTGRFVSVTVVVAAAPLYYAWLIRQRGFGSYKQLYAMCLIQGVYSQTLVALAIALAIFTGHDNIYTVPEFYPPSQGGSPLPVDGKNWVHAAAHILLAGAVFFPLVTWLVGSLVLAALRRLSPRPA